MMNETLKPSKSRKDYGYVLDPHGAVAFVALEKYLAETEGKANPAHFLETSASCENFQILTPNMKKSNRENQ